MKTLSEDQKEQIVLVMQAEFYRHLDKVPYLVVELERAVELEKEAKQKLSYEINKLTAMARFLDENNQEAHGEGGWFDILVSNLGKKHVDDAG